MEGLPLPRSELTPTAAGAAIERALPDGVRTLLGTLRGAGHAAYAVGGSLRDILLGRSPRDWDVATSARPPQVQDLFSGAVYENRFGTVGVQPPAGGEEVEVTTFRTDHDYADHRRPHRVEFGDDIEPDLARRDFTVNALAWGGGPAGPEGLIDPFGGLADLSAARLRAVGEPRLRFEEDALRMLRAVRLAATHELTIEPTTLQAMADSAPLSVHLSGERIGAELHRLLEAALPSVGLRLMAETGLLDAVAPELASQRGIAQEKIPGDDLWEHTLRTVDAAPADRPVVRMAALLHDIGKPSTAADGHFYHHASVGAEMAALFLRRIREPRNEAERIDHLIGQHMFAYDPSWGDAAVRRFIGKVGVDALDDLFALRVADSLGSGQAADAGSLEELRRRVSEQIAARVALDRSGLAIDGDDLATLGILPGPRMGVVLDRLVERVIVEPALNERGALLALARAIQAEKP